MAYKCVYCNAEYNASIDAVKCAQSHNLVVVYLTREDLIALIRFLYSKDDSLLTESLIDSLMKYRSYKMSLGDLLE
jgi:hypothetical protein